MRRWQALVQQPFHHASIAAPLRQSLRLGDDGGWLWWIAYCPFFSGQESPRTRRSSTISPNSCGPSLVILGRFPPQLGPRVYYSEWTGASRSFGPTLPIKKKKKRKKKKKEEEEEDRSSKLIISVKQTFDGGRSKSFHHFFDCIIYERELMCLVRFKLICIYHKRLAM